MIELARASEARRVGRGRPRFIHVASAVAVLGAQGCESEAAATNARLIETSKLTDLDDDPDVVEVELVASEGTQRFLDDGVAEIWGYRDGAVEGSEASVPGPMLDVKRGQRVIVHFRNELPEGTTVHWHGLRVPNASDGTPSVQVEVPPNGEHDYELTATDAGTFWYHPHVRSDEQVERGLYGAVVVRGGTKVAVDVDRTLILDDVKLEASGKLSEDTTPLDVMLGRQGNVLLANGVRGGHIVSQSGARERWRFVNAANGRYFNLRLQRHRFLVIAWDGGILAEPYETNTLLIAPGERYEVIVDIAEQPGARLALETIHYDRGHEIPDPGPAELFEVSVQGTAGSAELLPSTWADPIDFEVPSDAPVREIELGEEEHADGGFPAFYLNDVSFPDVPPIVAAQDAVEVWNVQNDTEMDHPFHIHGLFFRVLETDGAPPEHDGWKDTVNIPQKQSVRLGVRYGAKGTWMYHCHILEHAERGMMGELEIE